MSALLAALVAFARDFGVAVRDPVVVSGTSNIVVHLRPAPIVARIPNVTAAGRDRPDVALGREIALTAHLHACGLPTTTPSALLPPGPHRIGDRWVSFLTYVELEPVGEGDAERAGHRLADLLEAAASLDDTDGLFDRSLPEEAQVVIQRLEGRIDEADRQVLIGWAREALIGAGEPRQALHGDPHRNNLGRRTDGEIVWFDFDDAVFDSPIVDLATLQRSWPAAAGSACARLGVDPGSPEMDRYVAQRELWGALWAQMFALELGGDHAAAAAAVIDARR